MEKPQNKNIQYNESLKAFNIDDKLEQFYNKPENDEELAERVGIIKDIPEQINTPKVLLKLGDPKKPDKFVHMKDEDGREYVIALPIEKQSWHRDIASFCRKLYKKDLRVLGGGYTHAEGDKLVIHGKSGDFGEADKSRVGQILREAFPQLNIEIISEVEKEREREENNKRQKYTEALEKIGEKFAQDFYKDVVDNMAVRMGHDMTMFPKKIDGSDSNLFYMVFRSENGSSFGVDTVFVGYEDENGQVQSKEVAQTRWTLEITKSYVENGVLNMEIKTEGGQVYNFSSPVNSLDEASTISNLDERDKIILNMYKESQDVYKRVNIAQIYHGLV
ncbi:MAG: hypothetical protein R3B39_02805 [Candidatus Paceibacterota bacterium]